MYGKTVRRRRALLLVLVVISLVLLTAYFGESAGGGLHSVQRGFLTVISPIQDGANAALKPVRGVFSFFGEVLHSNSRVAQLRREVDRLRRERIAEQEKMRADRELVGIRSLERKVGPGAYRGVVTNVDAQSANLWYSTVDIEAGSSEGVAINDPVVNGEGLVGKVTQVAPDGAQVSLITDSTVGVSARLSGSGAVGLIQPKVGDPEDLLMQYLPTNLNIVPGDLVVTSGTVSGEGESLFPPGIPVGTVSSVAEESPKSVNVRPAAELHNLNVVKVLTVAPGSRVQRVSNAIAKMPPGRQTGAAAGTGVAQVGGGG